MGSIGKGVLAEEKVVAVESCEFVARDSAHVLRPAVQMGR